MHLLAYILSYALLWILHLLPDFMLGGVSAFFSFLMSRVVGYRKKVIRSNLERAFPDISERERQKIQRRYYRHMADLFLETAVSHFDSDARYLRRIELRNPEVLNELYRKGKDVVAVTAHYGNWEFVISVGHHTKYRPMGAYKPLRNPYFDRMVKRSRERFNTLPVPMEKVARAMIEHKRENRRYFSIFVADQRPQWESIQYWTKFLGLDTPLYLGAEKMAKKLGAAVVFLKVKRIRRFHYALEIETICEEPGEMEQYAITEAHVRILEKMIREEPEYWLWSHKRWKHSYADYLKSHPDR